MLKFSIDILGLMARKHLSKVLSSETIFPPTFVWAQASKSWLGLLLITENFQMQKVILEEEKVKENVNMSEFW